MDTELLRSKKGGEFDGRLVVIIDESSASGSELVAGALQDWDRAVIVGRDSYGKGLVQREMPMGDGSAVRLTVARYHTPSGRVIQRPYEKGHKEDYYKAHADRLRGNETGELSDKPEYKTMRSRRTVYGGGGIRPDVKVESDTTQITNYYAQLVRRGVLQQTVTDYLDTERQSLKQHYPTFAEFEARFAASDALVGALKQQAEKSGVKYSEEEFLRSEQLIQTQLKALVAQRLYGLEAFYRVINPAYNEAYIKAMELLEKQYVE